MRFSFFTEKSSRNAVLLIYTGGTIGMKEDPSDGTLKPFDFTGILEEVPELRKFALKIDTFAFNPLIDSSDVEPTLWQALARLIRERYEDYDGFVILHGTDTMAYSASALSFMLENLGKPVIFTGSQLPIGSLRTDGKENLISAVEIATAKDSHGHRTGGGRFSRHIRVDTAGGFERGPGPQRQGLSARRRDERRLLQGGELSL